MLHKHLRKKRKGIITIEAVLATPVVTLLAGLCLFFTLLLLSWTSYGSLASELAKDLNLRSTGLSEANSLVPAGNVVMNGSTGEYDYTISKNQFSVNGKVSGNKVLTSYKNALIYSALDYKNQFYLPFCKFKNCNVDVLQLGKDGTYDTSISETSTLSNYIIRVTINYDFTPFSFMNLDLGSIGVQTTGYAVVT